MTPLFFFYVSTAQRKRKTAKGAKGGKAAASAMDTLDFFHQQTLNAQSQDGERKHMFDSIFMNTK